MSSPIERVSSNDAASLRAPRRAGGSSTSLSSLPSRFAQPPTLKPSSAEVQVDLSSASSQRHASSSSSRSSHHDRPKSVLPAIQSSGPTATLPAKARPRASIIESSQLWKTSAAKRAEKDWAIQTERSLYSDAKFKKYLKIVETTLASFDSVSEWADFISFLARLHKAMQAYPNYNAIPRKLIVAKRLAQCLNPALPSGVHQRALDVYYHIFGVIGLEGLRRDLHVWTSGLLPFFQYASTSVKPTLISIYESFYLPLQDDLHPLTKALQISLLPGLEEETSEYHERTLRLLDGVSEAVTQPFFLQNLWLTLITTPSVRLAALNYLTRRMPPVQDAKDPTVLVGKDLGLLVRGLAHALDDDVLLVRRNALEILVTHVQIDKPMFKSFIKRPDQVILVRSALNVVLRKDLSLNRRLYNWLLGADESPEKQISFLRQHALDLIRAGLKQDFDKDYTNAVDRQRTYRIFVSLLDKWEIGQSLTGVLALDAFRAISLAVARAQEEELMTTAKMLFEVVDPFLLYGRFLEAILGQFQPDATSATSQTSTAPETASRPTESQSPLALLCFIFKAFHIHDEETKQIHVPLIFAAVCQLILRQLQRHEYQDDAAALRALDALELLKLLVTVMPSRVFVRVAPTASDGDAASVPSVDDFVQRARSFYASSETDSQQAARNFPSFQGSAPATALVELLAQVCLESGKLAKEAATGTEAFVRALDVFADLMRVVDGSEAAEEIALVNAAPADTVSVATDKLSWDASTWATSLLPYLDGATTFAEVERIVEVLISCRICRALGTPIRLDPPQILDRIVASLLRYLSPAMSPYHVRAVELLWATCKVTQRSRLETAVTQQLSRGTNAAKAVALTAFGTFWRLSEDVSTDEVRTPLLIVLDKLQSQDADERQQGEIWLRANMRLYTKVVDPLLLMLHDNRASLSALVAEDIDGIRVTSFQLNEPFNQHLDVYAHRTLAALVRFGGPNLIKALAMTPLSTSQSTAMKHLLKGETLVASTTYLNALMDECTIRMRTYPSPQLALSYSAALTATRAAAIDFVLCLVQRGPPQLKRIDELEALLIEALLIAVHHGAIAVQAKMLQTLQTVIVTKVNHSNRPDLLQRRVSSTSEPQGLPRLGESLPRGEGDVGAGSRMPVTQKPAPSTTSPAFSKQPHRLLLPLLQRGLVAISNRSSLPQWSDFILTTTQLYRASSASFLLPLNQAVCESIARGTVEVGHSYLPGPSRLTFGAELVVQSQDTPCSFLESDLLLLVNLAERTLMLAASDTSSDTTSTSTTRNGTTEGAAAAAASPIISNEKTSQEQDASGMLGYVSNVFSSDAPSDDRVDTASSGRNRSLHLTIRTLHRLWTFCGQALSPADAKSLSLDAMTSKVQLRCRRAFERIYRGHPAATVESLLSCWQASVRAGRGRDEAATEAAIEILDIVTPSVQITVTFLCDVLGARIAKPDSERARKNGVASASATIVSNATLFLFFEALLARIQPQEAVQVWPVINVFFKDFIAHTMSRKVHVYPMMRLVTAFSEKLCLTTAIEDRRTKRELQDHLAKLMDSCILIAGKSFDPSTWIRRSGRDGEDLDKEAADFAAQLHSLEDEPRIQVSKVDGTASNAVIDAINHFLATRGLAALRKVQMDADRIQTIVSNVVYYIVAPTARTRSNTLEIDASVVSVISELVRTPGTVKAWRITVADVFNDARFFSMPLVKAERWKPIILALMTQDKDRISDILTRVSASAAATNIFANRELEMLSRALNLRRLSFAIFAGEQDAFLTQLPLIQEKLVDLLRSSVSEVLHAEVYLCLRILLVRFSARNLTSFWPVLMTELMRLYDQVATEPEGIQQTVDGRNLLLSTLKLLDLLVLIQPEDFQINEWLFVTDTIDAVYPLDDFQPETLLDQLSATFEKSSKHNRANDARRSGGGGPKRRLQLRMRSIKSVGELLPFLQSISQNAFEGNYSDQEIDFQDVDRCLLADMFDSGSSGVEIQEGSVVHAA